MKKRIFALLLVAITCVAVAGCSKKKATWLLDGQILEVIDNTLGEGEKYNIPSVHIYQNSHVEEARGYVYILPVSETNPKVRYFASIRQGESSNSNTKFIEITDVKNGDILTESDFIDPFRATYPEVDFIAGNSTAVHYSSVNTYTKYCYYVTKNNNITVWGDKILSVTITSSIISPEPISFQIEIKTFTKVPMLLGHKGDSWSIKES